MFRFIFCAVVLSGFAASHEEENVCPDGKKHNRATIRHIEKGGIGYQEGYTTFETFLAIDPSRWPLTPFFDAKGHVFNNGKWAANAGIGLRALWGNRAYGINTYYDYRNTGRLHANQIGLGLETLGEFFDARLNGYLPFGKKTSSPYAASFAAFSGNSMLISQKYQSAMKGANAEFGFHFATSAPFDFYAAAGPYYFIGEKTPATWGGKARISATIKDFISLEISDSYDRTFHNKFQGQLSFSLSFGPKSKVKKQGRSCHIANILTGRMLQPVARQEIIVIDKTRKNSAAIDPATGLPYFFVFVDNTSHSNGTYESPYHSLAQAQDHSAPYNIIYVFPGDRTTTGMDSGIALKANQKFWGSGISHLIQTSSGLISIPAQSSSSPLITNTNADTAGDAITLERNNAISGVTITSAMHDAIYGEDPQSLDVSSCTIENTSTFAIEVSHSDGASISLTNNQFLNNVNGIALTLNGTSTLTCANNTFDGQTSVSEPPLEIAAVRDSFVAQIENNIFHNNTGGGILFTLDDVANADIDILDNTFTNNGIGASSPSFSSSLAIRVLPGTTVDHCSIAFSGNTSSVNQSNSLYLHTDGTFTSLEATISENTISDNVGAFLVFATPVDTFTLLATDNHVARCNDNGIAVIAAGSSSTGQITINNNTITDIGNTSNAIAINQDFSTLHLTLLDNEIDICEGTGVLSFPPTSINSLTLDISGNTISNCQNGSGNAASGICFDNYSNLAATVANNTLSDNISPDLAIGLFSSGNPTVCLTLTGNSSNTIDTDTSYSLTNPGIGAFHLSPCNVSSVNTGTIDAPVDVIYVQSCPDGAVCP